jgi:hypothetical protein
VTSPPLDLSAQAAALAADLCRKVPELHHIDTSRVLFAISRSRTEGVHGTFARIAPLRFSEGRCELTRRRRGMLETFRMPSLRHDGRDILYVIYFMIPRFLRLSAEQRLNTLAHELFHISERFDGDLRRFPGRNFAHGASRAAYNRRIALLLETYRAATPDIALQDFLHLNEKEWLKRQVPLTGLSIPLPRARLVARRRV